MLEFEEYKAKLNAAKPTLVPFGPTARTSTPQISAVHSVKASRNPIAAHKSLIILRFIFIPSFLYLTGLIVVKTGEMRKKRSFTSMIRNVSCAFYRFR